MHYTSSLEGCNERFASIVHIWMFDEMPTGGECSDLVVPLLGIFLDVEVPLAFRGFWMLSRFLIGFFGQPWDEIFTPVRSSALSR